VALETQSNFTLVSSLNVHVHSSRPNELVLNTFWDRKCMLLRQNHLKFQSVDNILSQRCHWFFLRIKGITKYRSSWIDHVSKLVTKSKSCRHHYALPWVCFPVSTWLSGYSVGKERPSINLFHILHPSQQVPAVLPLRTLQLHFDLSVREALQKPCLQLSHVMSMHCEKANM
jgi:hypothetical protein